MCQARSTWHQAQKACVMRCATSSQAHANYDGPLHHLPVKVQSSEMAMGLEDFLCTRKCTMHSVGRRCCSDCYKNKVLVGACVEAPSEVGHLTTKANPLIEGRCGPYVFLTFDLNFGPAAPKIRRPLLAQRPYFGNSTNRTHSPTQRPAG